MKCGVDREQLMGQGYSVLKKGLMGVGIPSSSHWWRGGQQPMAQGRSQHLYLLIHWVCIVCSYRVPGPSTHRYLQCALVTYMVHHHLGIFCQVGWSTDILGFLGESCTVLTKDICWIWTMDIAYIVKCINVLSTFFKLVVYFCMHVF